jgi:hypothetical protein
MDTDTKPPAEDEQDTQAAPKQNGRGKTQLGRNEAKKDLAELRQTLKSIGNTPATNRGMARYYGELAGKVDYICKTFGIDYNEFDAELTAEEKNGAESK